MSITNELELLDRARGYEYSKRRHKIYMKAQDLFCWECGLLKPGCNCESLNTLLDKMYS